MVSGTKGRAFESRIAHQLKLSFPFSPGTPHPLVELIHAQGCAPRDPGRPYGAVLSRLQAQPLRLRPQQAPSPLCAQGSAFFLILSYETALIYPSISQSFILYFFIPSVILQAIQVNYHKGAQLRSNMN